MMRPYQKKKPWRSNAYLIYIRQQSCIICQHPETDAHHVRIQSNAGTGIKPSDFYGVPLCRLHHLESHHYGRNTFFERHGVDIFEELFKIVAGFLKEET